MYEYLLFTHEYMNKYDMRLCKRVITNWLL